MTMNTVSDDALRTYVGHFMGVIDAGQPPVPTGEGGGGGGISQADADLRYVNIVGDTMTGKLTIQADADITGRVDMGTFRVVNNIDPPGGTTGAGIEVVYSPTGNTGYIQVYDRNVLSYRPLVVNGQTISFGSGAASATPRWKIDASGHLLAATDNTYNIGAPGWENRPATIYTFNIESDLGEYGDLVVSNTATLGEIEANAANMAIRTGGPSGSIRFQSSDFTSRWVFALDAASSYSFLPSANNVYDIGATTARPRDLWLGRNLTVGGIITGSGAVPAGGGANQVLTKSTATDYALAWTTPSVGITIPLTQHLTFSPDNTYDVGQSGATRPRDLHLAGNAVVGGTVTTPMVGSPGATTLKFLTFGFERWVIQSTGHFFAGQDNAFDIGASGASRPRDVFLGRNLTVGGVITGSGSVPTGGTTGQVLSKTADTNYAVGWAAPSGGGSVPDPLIVDNATVRQKLTIGTAATPPFMIPRAIGTLSIEAPAEYLMLASKGGHVTANAYWDGTNWFSYDTAARSTLLAMGPTVINLYTAPPSAGALPLALMLTLTDTGATFGVPVTTSGLTNNGNASFTGNVSANGGFTAYNRTMMSVATGGVGSAGSSEGQLELQNAGSGACKIAFHRVGAYAAYFGLDTDNVWRVGGWSQGGPFTLYHTGNLPISEAVTGGSVPIRNPSGYLYANYINMTADVAGGVPAYVAGQNGDGFLRWYPKSSVTGALRTYGFFGAQSHASNATINRTTGINHNGCGVTHDGTSVYVQKTGTYVIYARSGASDNTWDPGRYQVMRIMTTRGNGDGYVTECPKGGSGSHVHQYYAVNLNAGDQVYFQVFQNSGYTINYDTGFWDIWYFASSA